MMRDIPSKALLPLAQATALAHQAELMRLQRAAAHEARLRLSLKELERRATESFLHSAGAGGLNGAHLRVIGQQDRAWRDWSARQRATIQAEMARVRAEKADQLTRLSRSLGRKSIAEDLLGAARAQEAAARDQARMQQLQALSLMKRR